MEPTAPPYYSRQNSPTPRDSLEEIICQKKSNYMYAKASRRNRPYDNCQKQLCEMESSSNAPSYENVAQFQVQQRKIASELEKTNNFNPKGTRCSNSSLDCCQHYRICHSNCSTVRGDTSITSFPSCEFEQHTSLNETIVAGQLIYLKKV